MSHETQNQLTGRSKAQHKQCRLAQFIEGKPNTLSRVDNSPGCPCEKFCECHLGLHMDNRTDVLWKWFDRHDFFPDWKDFHIDLKDETNSLWLQ